MKIEQNWDMEVLCRYEKYNCWISNLKGSKLQKNWQKENQIYKIKKWKK